MLIVEQIVGNITEDPELAQLNELWSNTGRVEQLNVDVWESQKSRLRKKTDQGTEVGINLDRGQVLRHGDVLYIDHERRHLILVTQKSRYVLVIRLLPQNTNEEYAQVALKLGHILGNQHWPVKLDGLAAYIPVVVDQKVMDTVLRTHNLKGISWHFEEADPTMDLPLVFPSLDDHVHAHPAQHQRSGSSHRYSHHHHHDHDHQCHDQEGAKRNSHSLTGNGHGHKHD